MIIDSLLINAESEVKECLKTLDKTGMGVLIVVSDDKKMIGTLTDGDIRRAILSGKKLEDSIERSYNSKPFFLYENYSDEEARQLFIDERIEVLPIVKKDGTIVSILDWEIFFGEKKHDTRAKLDIPVVIMAGGRGTRMAPFTNVLPKPLIPIGDKTILEIIIDEFLAYQIEEYYFTLNFKGQMIEAYFNSIEKSYNVNHLWEKEFEGTAGSLKLLPFDEIRDDFILSNCDVIVKADYCEAYKHHNDLDALITVLSSIQHYKIPYGVVDFGENGEVKNLKEKPEYTFSINTGVYIVSKEALKYLPDSGVFHMTHLMEKIMKEEPRRVVAFPVNENDYIDIGQWDEYRKTIEKIGI